MSETQQINIILNENNMQQFFKCLRILVFFGKRSVKIHISEESIKVLRKLAKKKSKVGNESNLKKMTFKVNDEFIDIIYDDKNNVVEISFGAFNKKRVAFTPYKRKTTIKLDIVTETE